MAKYGQDPQRLQARCLARKAADAALELINESMDGDPIHFWRVIRDYASDRIPEPNGKIDPLKPMTEIEATRFANDLMPYGEFKGSRVGSVPLERLDWLAGTTDDFKLNLRRYLLTPSIHKLVRQSLGDD